MAKISGLDMGGGTGNAARSGYYVAQVKKPPITQNKQTIPVNTSNNYVGYSEPTYEEPTGGTFNDYLAALQSAREDAIAKANAAVDAQTSAAEGRYRNQLVDVGKDYQDLRNQSEVNRYKALKRQREALANQGRLDAGAGRMENTVLRNNFDNNLNEINLKEASEKRQIESAINELYAQAAALKAQNEMATLSNFGDALMYGLNSGALGGYSYNPSTSDYYNAASGLANTYYNPINAVSDGQTAGATTAAKVQAMQDNVNPQKKNWSMMDTIRSLITGNSPLADIRRRYNPDGSLR